MYISVQDKSTNSCLGLLSCPEYTQLRCYFMAAYLDKFDKLKFKNIVQLLSNYLALILAMVLATSSNLLAVPLSIMALPDWAYAERQRLSPILLRGEVMEVSCHEVQCTLKMKILQVLRNQSQRNIAHGDSLLINFVGKVSLHRLLDPQLCQLEYRMSGIKPMLGSVQQTAIVIPMI